MNNNKNTVETITITKIEYDEMKAQIEQMQQQIQWLMEQLKLAKREQFGVSSEQTASD